MSLRIGRIGSYPTATHNTVGKYAYELSFIDKTESYIFSPSYPGEWLKCPNVKQIKSYSVWARRSFPSLLPLKLVSIFFWYIYMIWTQFRAIIFFSGKRIEIVHIHSQMYSLVAIWARVFKKKVFITFHGEDYNNLIRSSFLQKLLFPYKKIFVISPLMQVGLSNYFDGSIVYTPNGVDTKLFRNLNLYRDQNILCVGSFKSVKNHNKLIYAFCELVSIKEFSEFNLILVGEGPLKSNMIKLVKSLNLENSVFFLGNKTSKELVKLYNSSALLVLASLREGFPKVILESLSCNLPTLSTRVGAISTLFNHDFDNWLDLELKNFVDKVKKTLVYDYSEYFQTEKYSWNDLRSKVKKEYYE